MGLSINDLKLLDLKLLPEIKVFLDWGWDINIRADGRVELICPHGIGHTAWSQLGFLEHGCDGCCDSDHFKDVVKKLKDLHTATIYIDYIATSTTETGYSSYGTSTSGTY